MQKRAVRSARGVEVNFDLLKIKQQIASAPKTTEVKARESFIDQKFKRRLKRVQAQVADDIAITPGPQVFPEVVVEKSLPEPDQETSK
jgi:hypothetical protein